MAGTESQAKTFNLLEQMAIKEVLILVNRGHVEFENVIFFSRVETEPVVEITNPSLELMKVDASKEGYLRYLRTTVSLYCREEKIAAVVIEGAVCLNLNRDWWSYWRVVNLSVRGLRAYGDRRSQWPWKGYPPFHCGWTSLSVKSGFGEKECNFVEYMRAVLQI